MESTLHSPSSAIDVSESLIRRFDSLGPRYTSYPTADRFHSDFNAQSYSQYLEEREAAPVKPPLSLYIHVPFCASLCYYCACNKVITKDHSRSAKYLDYLGKELALVHKHLTLREVVSQLHLGGGTPTFLRHDELRQLMVLLHAHFEFADDAEISIEIDPRTVDRATLTLLAELGFNRTSLGVQDFDADVQKAVHRIQPFELVAETVATSRDLGFGSVNFDLIYGLPKQTLASFNATLDQVIALSPDRIALYNYAHLPTRFKSQRRIAEADLPSVEQRLQIFMMSLRRLLEEGYVYIGLDHFAKPNDSLALAAQDHSLHRNFQGYTTRADCDLIALGLSSIGKVGRSYVQNVRTLEDYYARLDAGEFPVEKGFRLSQDDALRRQVIMHLMCAKPIDFAEMGKSFGVNFGEYFAEELAQIAPYAEEGLIALDADSLRITAKGRLFVRAVGMRFDQYLIKCQNTQAQYSRLI